MKTGTQKKLRVKRPIGAKLVIIVVLITIVSLGAITTLVSWMIRQDLQVTAEDSNMTVNARSAAEAEELLTGVEANANFLLNTISSRSATGELAVEAASYFFDQHKTAAAVLSLGGMDMTLINERFFDENDIDPGLVTGFVVSNNRAVGRAASGEAVLVNAAPDFGYPLTALFYPRSGGAAVVLFSAESMSESFGAGGNNTFLINDEGQVLAHPNAELTAAAVNLSNDPFVRTMQQSALVNEQTLYTGDGGIRFFAAFSKLSIANAAVITTVEERRVFEGIDATTRRNIYLSAAVLCIAGIFIYLFSKSISTPVKMLAETANAIREGDFDIHLKAKTKDEIGLLTESFQSMGQALNIFGRFTNREIAVGAMRGEIKPGGSAKNATIFFSDIRGFTEKSEKFTQEFGAEASDKIVQWLNAYFTRMIDCVEKTNGVVDKFIGDAVMAHWGTAYTAGSPEADAFNCVKAAIMMRFALVKMNAERKKDDPGDPPIRIGCGINTGVVTAGQLGSEQRMEYTVIGDPVNLASRTEALNKPLGTDILITENTWDLVGKFLITQEMPPVTVKGKEKPVRMFAVVNFKPKAGEVPRGPQTLAELRTLLGIEPPDLSKVDTDAQEKKYKIGEA